MKLKVIVNNNLKTVKPCYLYEKVGWHDYINELYRFFLNIKVIEDEKEFLSFFNANVETFRLFAHTEVKHKAYLRAVKGGATS